jgi:hypothetical protein
MMKQTKIYGSTVLPVQIGADIRRVVVVRGPGSTRPFEAYPVLEDINSTHGTSLKVASHDVACALSAGQKSGLGTDFVWALNNGTARHLPDFVVDVSYAYEKPRAALTEEIAFQVNGDPKVTLKTGGYNGQKGIGFQIHGLNSADVAYVINGEQRTLDQILEKDGIKSLLATDYSAVTEIRLLVQDTDARLISLQNVLEQASGSVHPYVGPRILCQNGLFVAAKASTRVAVVAEIDQSDIWRIEPLFSKS